MGFWAFIMVAVLVNSRLGRALADAIAERGGGLAAGELEAAEDRLEDRLIELEDRLEYTERLLQQQRGRSGLPPIT